MSEEIAVSVAGLRCEPPLGQMSISMQQSSPVSSTPASFEVTSSQKKSRPIPGGGTTLPDGDKPGDPFATLIVLAADGLLSEEPHSLPSLPASGGRALRRELPPYVGAGLERLLTLLEECERCVVVCSGGPVLSTALMQEIVRRVPGGLDSFGPGRLVEALHKERAAPGKEVDSSVQRLQKKTI